MFCKFKNNKFSVSGYFMLVLVMILIFSVDHVYCQQNEKHMTLHEVIQLARQQSPDALLAKHRFLTSYWQFRTYKASFRPSLLLNSNLVDFNRSLEKYKNADGSYTFTENNANNSSASLKLNQNLPFTGGSIFMASSLQRIDYFKDSTLKSYLSTPISIGFSQPLSSFNEFRWERKIEPLRYEEAKRRYVSSLEDISIKAVNLFFDQILAQFNVAIAEANFSNNDTLLKISRGRYNIGTIAKNDLLQMELQFLNSRADLNQVRLALEVAKYKFRSFLGYNEKVKIVLDFSPLIPNLSIDILKAKELAYKNNPEILNLSRILLESERDVRRAKAENFFNASLYAAYGLTQSGMDLDQAYKNPREQQQISVGIQIPILDWGQGRGRYKMAQSAFELTRISNEQALSDFDQEVYLNAAQFNMQGEQLDIAAKSDTIATLRYDVTKQRFMVGKIDVLDLNIASTEKDMARRNYVVALRTYWQQYYNIRKITLFDFENGVDLTAEFDGLVK